MSYCPFCQSQVQGSYCPNCGQNVNQSSPLSQEYYQTSAPQQYYQTPPPRQQQYYQTSPPPQQPPPYYHPHAPPESPPRQQQYYQTSPPPQQPPPYYHPHAPPESPPAPIQKPTGVHHKHLKPSSKPGSRKRAIVAVVIVVILIFAGLSIMLLSKPSVNTSLGEFVMPEEDGNLDQVMLNNNSIVYTYHTQPDNLSYDMGDIIVGEHDLGYLRKITNINQDGNVVTVETEQAALTDVIEEGEWNLDQPLSIDGSSNGTRSTFTIKLENTLYKSGGTEVKATGQASVKTNLVFKGYIKDWKIKNLEFYVENTYSFSLGLEANHAVKLEKETVLSTHYLPTVPIQVGIFPIYLTPKLEFAVGAELELEGSVSTEISASLTLKGGVKYTEKGGWTLINAATPTWDFTAPTLETSASAEVYAVVPKMELLAYGVVGPNLELKPYLKLDASLSENPWWTLSAGLKGECGVECEVFDHEIIDISFEIFDLETKLADSNGGGGDEGDGTDEDGPQTNVQSLSTGNFMPIPTKVGDSYRYGYYYQGDRIGSLTTELLAIQNYDGEQCYKIQSVVSMTMEGYSTTVTSTGYYAVDDMMPKYVTMDMSGEGYDMTMTMTWDEYSNTMTTTYSGGSIVATYPNDYWEPLGNLYVGLSRSFSYTMNSDGYIETVYVHILVVSQEDVTVPAGTYEDCYRVEMTTTASGMDMTYTIWINSNGIVPKIDMTVADSSFILKLE